MALFKDIFDFKQYIPNISRHYTWDNLKGMVDQYTLKHVIPYLSTAFFNPLQTRYLAGTNTALDDAILPWLKPAIAQYTYLHLLTTDRINLSQMGVTESSSSDGTASPASHYAINDAKAEAAEMADGFMDDLLEYLEANKDDYSLWKDSSAYTEINSCFISSTAQLNRYVKARNSRRTFLAVKADLLFVQENRIKPILGETFYDALLAEYKTGSLSPENQKAIDRIRPYLAKAAMVEAIPNHSMDFLDGGILVKSFLEQTPAKSQARQTAILHLIGNFSNHAKELRTNLIQFLDDNAADYAGYTETEYTLSDGEVSLGPLNNEGKNSFRV